jgi:hypothetical protein
MGTRKNDEETERNILKKVNKEIKKQNTKS